jgi:hypothetical protein
MEESSVAPKHSNKRNADDKSSQEKPEAKKPKRDSSTKKESPKTRVAASPEELEKASKTLAKKDKKNIGNRAIQRKRTTPKKEGTVDRKPKKKATERAEKKKRAKNISRERSAVSSDAKSVGRGHQEQGHRCHPSSALRDVERCEFNGRHFRGSV